MELIENKIAVIGSEGFLGKAIKRNLDKKKAVFWSHNSSDRNSFFNLLDEKTWDSLLSSEPNAAIFLSWPGLPRYNETFHVSRNLPLSLKLFECLINRGLKKLVVTGTCYEYGMQSGCLKENICTYPINQYAIAKDALRKSAYCLTEKQDVSLAWGRIFYPYGPFQNPKSLMPSLERAIQEKKEIFYMSSGEQVRDFIHVDKVAEHLINLCINPFANGIYNIGSGEPIKLIDFINSKISQKQSQINLITNFYKDRCDEPKEFWADMTKLNQLNQKSI